MHTPRHSATDILVVGAGPAGLMAALAAARAGRRVEVLEQLDRPGLKLLATGGGRCNLTCAEAAEALMARFGRQGRFMAPALALLDPQRLRERLAELGVPTVVDEHNRVYPASQAAGTVLSALLDAGRDQGVQLRTGVAVEGLWIEASRLRGLQTRTGRLEAPRVVLATGGQSYPELGGTGGGYSLAEQAGHTLVPPTPALVGLVTVESWPARCAGVSLQGVRVWIDRRGQAKAGLVGDVLFTHRGLSGPAILDLSGDVAGLLARGGPVPLRLDLTEPDRGEPANLPSPQRWQQRLARWRQRQGTSSLRNLLARHLPRALAHLLCELAGLDAQTRAAELPADARDALVGLLTALPLTVSATEGFGRAMVTRGGVSLRDVDPHTLQSRRLAGLSLAGELLDLDGPSGGYNLHWAFASGSLAGQAAAG